MKMNIRKIRLTVFLPTFLWLLMLLLIAGCFGTADIERDLMRLRAGQPFSLVATIPNSITFTRIYDTTIDLVYESENIEISLNDMENHLAKSWADSLGGLAPNLKINALPQGAKYISIINENAAKSVRGYALFAPLPEELTNELDKDGESVKERLIKNDSHPQRWLLPVGRPFGNSTEDFYHSLDFKGLRKESKNDYLLLITIDSISAIDKSGALDVSIQIRARLLDLRHGIFSGEFLYVENVGKAQSLTLGMLKGISTKEELLGGNAQVLQRVLRKLGKRYAHILAAQLHFISTKELEKQMSLWAKEDSLTQEK